MINKTKTDYMNNDLSREVVLERYFNAIQKHDYSHMYSDDDRAWRSGKQSEDEIKQYIHTLITIFREDATQLLEDSLYEVKEGYTNGLTHKVIRSWFKDYVDDVNSIFVKPYTKAAFEEKDGMYYVGDKFEVDGDGWVSEEQLELLLLEEKNGVQ